MILETYTHQAEIVVRTGLPTLVRVGEQRWQNSPAFTPKGQLRLCAELYIDDVIREWKYPDGLLGR